MKNRYEFANVLKLEIHQGKYVDLDSRWKKEQVCDPFTRLYYIRSGDGYLRRNGQKLELQPGYVYLIPSGCEFDYGCTQLSKLFFHITVTAAEGFDLLSAIPDICRVPFPEGELDELMECCGSDDYADLIKLKMLLYQTVVACGKQGVLPPMPVRRYSELVMRAVRFIRENVGVELSAAMIAKELFVSESRLRKCFREETGMPLGKYIDDLVFLRAKQLLMDGARPIGQISQDLGFCDQFYFSRRFKERFHQTPTDFRRTVMGTRN